MSVCVVNLLHYAERAAIAWTVYFQPIWSNTTLSVVLWIVALGPHLSLGYVECFRPRLNARSSASKEPSASILEGVLQFFGLLPLWLAYGPHDGKRTDLFRIQGLGPDRQDGIETHAIASLFGYQLCYSAFSLALLLLVVLEDGWSHQPWKGIWATKTSGDVPVYVQKTLVTATALNGLVFPLCLAAACARSFWLRTELGREFEVLSWVLSPLACLLVHYGERLSLASVIITWWIEPDNGIWKMVASFFFLLPWILSFVYPISVKYLSETVLQEKDGEVVS